MEIPKDHNVTNVNDQHSTFETRHRKTDKEQHHCHLDIIPLTEVLEEIHGFDGTTIKRSHQRVFEKDKKFRGR